jgi:acetylornithine/N-succinyldiaminopimelate aminotransferase
MKEEEMIQPVKQKEELFRSLLQHPAIKEVRSHGLWMALEFDSFETNKKVIDRCIEMGLLTDWFLFAASSLRISPPLIISREEIEKACAIILEACDGL